MTTQDLGRPLGQDLDRSSTTRDDAIGALFDSSPARSVKTSAAAETAFVVGVLGLLLSPFSLMAAFCLGLAAVGLVTSIFGLARASRPATSGGVLASVGLVTSIAAAAVIGLRYLGIDTAIGDAMVPTLADWLRSLNDLLPPTR
ncbi:MAG: hypothetical protein ABWY19_12930 [Marmoricola sp.]